MNLAHQDKQFYTHFTHYWDIFSKNFQPSQLITPLPQIIAVGTVTDQENSKALPDTIASTQTKLNQPSTI